MIEPFQTIAVISAGFACGFINTLAGSGSLITLPLLIFLGLPAPVANGTNRVAIVIQNIVGVTSFKQQKVLDIRVASKLAVPAVLGAIVGANIAVDMNAIIMERVIGALMLAMVPVIMWKPGAWLKKQAVSVDRTNSLPVMVIFFLIGVYGGFVQAGVGIFLLIGLVYAGQFDLVKGNAIKVFIVLCFTIFALGVFLVNGYVDWKIGLTLAVGNGLGAMVASRLAVKRGEKFVKLVLLIAILIGATKLLGIAFV
jgi:uncharacterized membrane protein YfcA